MPFFYFKNQKLNGYFMGRTYNIMETNIKYSMMSFT